MKLHKMWIEQCEATPAMEAGFGIERALACLVDEQFINFLEGDDVKRRRLIQSRKMSRPNQLPSMCIT